VPDKYYLIISISLISLIGVRSIFWAGYEPEKIGKTEEEINLKGSLQEFKNKDKDNKEEQEKEEIVELKDKKIKIEKLNSTDNPVVCDYKIKGIPSPKAIKFRPKSDEVWITSLMNKEYGVVVFNRKSGALIKKIKLPDGGGVEVTFNKNGSIAFVSQMETGRVFQINTADKNIEKVLDTKSSWTKVMVLNGDEEFLFTSNWTGNDISKINLSTNQVQRLETTKEPRGLYLNQEFLYVAGFSDGEIIKHNLDQGTAKTLISTGGAMRSIVGADKYLYVSDMARGSIYKVNTETDEVVKFVDTDNNPDSLIISPDNKLLIISNRGVNYSEDNYSIPGPEWGTILFYDLQSGQKLNALIAGNQPTGLDISRNLLDYSNFLDGEVIVCNLPTYEELIVAAKDNLKNYKEKILK
jgi:sugar lactone lactonase YvrE